MAIRWTNYDVSTTKEHNLIFIFLRADNAVLSNL